MRLSLDWLAEFVDAPDLVLIGTGGKGRPPAARVTAPAIPVNKCD